MAQVVSGKQRQWLERVKQWRESGLGVREFCRRHRLSEPSFFAWRRTLRQRGLIENPAAAKAGGSAPAFVQIPVANGAAMASGVGVSPIEVVLGKGRRLRVRPGFDAETLRQLLRLLEESSAC